MGTENEDESRESWEKLACPFVLVHLSPDDVCASEHLH